MSVGFSGIELCQFIEKLCTIKIVRSVVYFFLRNMYNMIKCLMDLT